MKYKFKRGDIVYLRAQIMGVHQDMHPLGSELLGIVVSYDSLHTKEHGYAVSVEFEFTVDEIPVDYLTYIGRL